MVDIIAFVSKGDFPRSRLGEKQRGKILASWVTRKMRTIAQFGIRDADGADSQITEVAEPRSGIGSLRNGSMVGGRSSLRNVESAAGMHEQQGPGLQEMEEEKPYSLPAGISEMPANYADSIQQSPPLLKDEPNDYLNDATPTDNRHNQFDFGHQQHDVTPADGTPSSYYHDTQPTNPPQTYGSTDYSPQTYLTYRDAPTLSLPSVTGHEPLMPEGSLWSDHAAGQQQQQRSHPAAPGGLRVANASSEDDTEEEWPQEAIMHMKLAGNSRPTTSSSKRAPTYGGSAYRSVS